ncbi:MAG: tetratricopeptide repeat protein [Myxococcota bacterium]
MGDEHDAFVYAYLCWLHQLTGRFAESQKVLARFDQLIDQFDDPQATAINLTFHCIIRHGLGEIATVQDSGKQLIELCSDYGFPFWLALGRITHGWARVAQGQAGDDGIAEIQQGIDFFHTLQQGLPLTYWLSYLVEANAKLGRFDTALATVERALDLSAVNADSFYEAELRRLRGQLLDQLGRPDEGVRSFADALTVAEQQGAHGLALRAAMSACAAHRQRGHSERGRELLAAACARFEPDDDAAPVLRARAMLDDLA